MRILHDLWSDRAELTSWPVGAGKRSGWIPILASSPPELPAGLERDGLLGHDTAAAAAQLDAYAAPARTSW